VLRKIPLALWLVVPLAFFLYFYHLGAVGLFGPDEPRYASIAREMAHSGDWITPRLWGEPWFEKPALLYWMEGIGFAAGLDTEWAPRLPVALLAAGFLAFYWWILRREFGCRAAWFSTLILGTCVGYWGASQAAVPDLPLTATFSAAMLLALPWVGKREGRFLPAAGALLGLAVLAKGLLPLVLAAPFLWWSRGKSEPPGGQFRMRAVLLAVAVAAPWYMLCYAANGWPFIEIFFMRHQFGRFTSADLMHEQPWAFYAPVLLGLLAPWTPLIPLAARRTALRDPRRQFLLAWVLFGLVFFSLAVNKLPGYVLPLLPAAAALLGAALDEASNARRWLACCVLLLVMYPAVEPMLPAAVAVGTSRAPGPTLQWTWLLPLVLAVPVWLLETRGRRLAAMLCLTLAATAGAVYLKLAAAPQLDRRASARSLWHEIEGRAGGVCVGEVERNWRYGLNYYSVEPLPDCAREPKPVEVRQSAGQEPHAVPLTLLLQPR